MAENGSVGSGEVGPEGSTRRHRWAVVAASALALFVAGVWAVPRMAVPVLSTLGVIPEDLEIVMGSVEWSGVGGFEVQDLSVSGAWGTIVTDTAHVSVGFRGIRSVRLVHPRLALSGSSNSGASDSIGSGGGLPDLGLGSVEIVSGEVSGVREVEGTRTDWSIEAIELAAHEVRLGAPPLGRVDLLRFTARSSTLDEPVRVEANGTLASDGLRFHSYLASSRSDVSFEGEARLAGGVADILRSVRGTLTADPLALQDLDPFVSRPLPAGNLRGFAQIEGSDGEAVGRLELALEDGGRGHLDGTVTAPPGGPMRADVDVSLVDVGANAFGLDRPTRLTSDLDIALHGPGWRELSGGVRGELRASDPAIAGTVDLESSEGEVEGAADLDWDGRGVVLKGSVSLADSVPPWSLAANVALPEGDSVHLTARGTGRVVQLRTRGVVRAVPFEASGNGSWVEHPRLSMRLGEIPSRLDSAQVEFGRPAAGDLRVDGYKGEGRLVLRGDWSDGRVRLAPLTMRDWPIGGERLGSWTGQATGSVAPGDGGALGELMVQVDSVSGGSLDGLRGTVDAQLRGTSAALAAQFERPMDRAEFRGSVAWGENGFGGALETLSASRETGSGAQRLEWTGSLALQPQGWTGGGHLNLDGPTDSDPAVDLDIETTDGVLEARGGARGSFGGVALDARVEGGWRTPGPLSLSLTADSLRIPPRAVASTLSGDTVAAQPLVAVRPDPLSALVDTTLADAVSSPTAEGPNPMEVVLAARARLELPRWSAGLEGANLDVQGSGRATNLRIDSISARVDLADQHGSFDAMVAAAGLDLRSRGSLSVDGFRPLLDSMMVMARIDSAAVLPSATGGRFAGTGSADLNAWRDGDAFRGEGRADVEGLLAPGVRAPAATATFAVAGRGDELTGTLDVDVPEASLGGGPPVEVGIEARAQGPTFAATAVVGTDLELGLSGVLGERELRLEDGRLRVGPDDMVLSRPALLSFAEGTRIDTVDFRSAGPDPAGLALAGQLSGEGRWRATWDVERLSSGPLLSWSTLSGGFLGPGEVTTEGAFIAAGSGSVAGEGMLQWVGALEGGEPFDVVASLNVDERSTAVSAQARVAEAPASLELTLPRGESEAEPTLALEASGFPLDPFFPGTGGAVGTFEGARVDGAVRRVGSGDDARLEGDLAARVDRWDLATVDLSFEDIDLRFRQTNLAFQVEGSAESGSGEANVSGSIALAQDGSPTLDLTLDTRRFPVAWTQNMVIRTVGELHVTGPLNALHIRGDVTAEESEIVLGASTAVEQVDLTEEDLELLRERFGWRGDSEDGGSLLSLDGLSVDLDARIGGDVWVRRWAEPELAIALEGNVEVKKDSGAPFQYFGTVSPLPEVSSFRQFGRRFALTSGSVQLLGPIESIEFTVTGEHEIPSRTDPSAPEATIDLTVQGSPGDLSVVLSSDPSMDQGDIVSYLLLGQPSGDLASTDRGTAAEAGAGVALSRISSLLGETGARAIGLDVVDLEPRGLGGLTLVAGRYVTPRLFVAVRQPVSWEVGSEATGSERLPELEAEFRAARWLLVNLEGDAEGFGLILRTRLAY